MQYDEEAWYDISNYILPISSSITTIYDDTIYTWWCLQSTEKILFWPTIVYLWRQRKHFAVDYVDG